MTRTRCVALCALVLACNGEGQVELDPETDVPVDTEDTQDTSPPQEVCDGLDNDGDGVVDNGLEYDDYWLDADNDGYGGPTGFNCSDLLNEGQPDGVYEIWPEGREEAPLTVYCDQTTDGGGWARVFRHDVAAGFFESHVDAWHSNEDDPDAPLYSILKHLERLRNPDGTLELRINWPDSGIPGRNIWRQTSNPTTAPVVGYEAVDVDYSQYYWGGLELSTSDATYLDGSVQHAYWFYAIGSHVAWNGGIPAYSPAASQVALWVRTDAVGGAEVIRDCKQPDGYAPTPGDCDDRDPTVSPGAEEVCNGVDDDCDGQTDIGCPYGDVEVWEGPGALHFYARDPDTDTCTFTVEGTGVGAASQVRVAVYEEGVLLSQDTAAADSFALTLTLDAGLHLYDVELSWDSDSGHWTPAQTVQDVVCGDVILIDGQSNAVASDYHSEGLGDLERSTFVRSFGSSVNNSTAATDTSFAVAVADTAYVRGAIGQWGLRMANRLVEETSMPILVINGAVGGTSVWSHQRNASDPTDLDTIYGRLLWRARQAGVADAVRAVVWHQGESDGATAYADYLGAWTAMYEGWLADYANLEGVYVMQVRAGCGGPTWNRNVHRDLPGLLEKVIGHMSTTGVDGHDGCHFTNQAYAEWGERMARLVHRDLYDGVYDGDIEAPDPVSATWLSSTELQIEFGDTGEGLVLQSGAEGWFSLSDGAAVSGARVEGTTVVLTTTPSSATWVSFVDGTGDIPWLVNGRGVGSFAWYALPIGD